MVTLTTFSSRAALLLAGIPILACSSAAHLPVTAGMGPAPALPSPRMSIIPTINVVEAKGWAPNAAPVAGHGMRVVAFARGLDHPRWLYVLPNGDVLVAETNAPKRPKDGQGIKGIFFRIFQNKAGGAVPSANRITLLRDGDGDGVAETRATLLDSLYSPFGMALIGNTLYIANSNALVRVPYAAGDTHINTRPVKVV